MSDLEKAIRTHWAYIMHSCNAETLYVNGEKAGTIEKIGTRERLEKVLAIERELSAATKDDSEVMFLERLLEAEKILNTK